MFWETFGSGGTAEAFFGGQWWVVGFFILIILISFLLAYRINYQGIIFITMLGLISAGAYSLFYVYSLQYVQTIVFLVLIYVAYIAYNFFSK